MASTEKACLAIVIACSLDIDANKKKKRRKRIWMKEWLKKRDSLSHKNLLMELQLTCPADYINYLRMDINTFHELLEMVTPYIKKQDTKLRLAIPPKDRLSATLRYLASGTTFENLKFETAIAAQTLGKIILETCEAIIKVLKPYIQIPRNEDQWKKVALNFEERWNFPHCLGAIDGKHVEIEKPTDSGSYYFNYKQSFSIVLMALVNANYEFLMVDVGANGRVSDGGVFANTLLYKKLQENLLHIPKPDKLPLSDFEAPYVFIGDDAFPLMENLMKPFSNKNLTNEEIIYNYRVSRARRIVENAFGILTSRFRILSNKINLCPEKAVILVLTCCYLHNFLRHKKVDCPRNENNVTDIGTGELLRNEQCSLLALDPLRGRNYSLLAKKVRQTFCNYFNTIGSVPWQENMCMQ